MSYGKYDLYTSVQSIYCYKDSNVLKNKLHITNAELLSEAEENITQYRQMILMEFPIKGRYSKNHLCNIHRFLFSDIYSFAGQLRKEQISKGTTLFYPPTLIDRELKRLFETVKNDHLLSESNFQKQIIVLSYIMSELNMIHPFREGNGRTIREFIRTIALHWELTVDWSLISREAILNASIASVDDDKAFVEILSKCIC